VKNEDKVYGTHDYMYLAHRPNGFDNSITHAIL